VTTLPGNDLRPAPPAAGGDPSWPDPAPAIRADTSPAGLRAAIRDDLEASAVRRRSIAGERVVRSEALLAYLSDIASPDVNEVVRARFGPGGAADAAIETVLREFGDRPFLWWLGEDDRPADLGERLAGHGLVFLDEIPGLALDLADLAPAEVARPPAELRVEPVLDPAAMDAFHAVLVHGFPEDFVDPATEVEIAIATRRRGLATGYREADGLPTRWLGTVDGRPVTTTRLHTAAGVAGIYAVVTVDDARRRGYGEAVTRHVLRAARDAGLRIATLQASNAGLGIYERIGFRIHYRYRLYERRPPRARPGETRPTGEEET
jgi:ribosomal protein S18 acetylase RimI-like enzyme